MLGAFRPWGHVDWLMARLPGRIWHFLGCISTEERCLAAWEALKPICGDRVNFVVIEDPDPADKAAVDKIINERKAGLDAAGIAPGKIETLDLMAGIPDILAQGEAALRAGVKDVILDISTLPKRFFFPLIKSFILDGRVKNLVATYTLPLEYGTTLAENPQACLVLPGFPAERNAPETELAIVSIGFQPLGLAQFFSDQNPSAIRLLFPFPPGPPGYSRNWQFVNEIEKLTQHGQMDQPTRLDSYDPSQAFDAIAEMTGRGSLVTALAPYGPKPISLAMCLYSVAAQMAGKRKVPIYYAQPMTYETDYTRGVVEVAGRKKVIGYALKLGGAPLYQL